MRADDGIRVTPARRPFGAALACLPRYHGGLLLPRLSPFAKPVARPGGKCHQDSPLQRRPQPHHDRYSALESDLSQQLTSLTLFVPLVPTLTYVRAIPVARWQHLETPPLAIDAERSAP